MARRISVAHAIAGVLLVAATVPASALPWIEFSMSPALPDHVENPGGLFTGWCLAHPDGTFPEQLVVRVLDSNGVLVSEWSATDTFEYTVFYALPDGAPDGIYRYQVEYWSSAGLSASIDEGFLVAGATTGICAFKFEDLNGNGVYDPPTETLLSGWEICNPTLGCKFTDADGAACWFFIAPGTYTMCETLQSGWEAPVTPVCQDIDVFAGDIAKVMFGNRVIITPVEETSWGAVKDLYR
jgi:hypothetical protein